MRTVLRAVGPQQQHTSIQMSVELKWLKSTIFKKKVITQCKKALDYMYFKLRTKLRECWGETIVAVAVPTLLPAEGSLAVAKVQAGGAEAAGSGGATNARRAFSITVTKHASSPGLGVYLMRKEGREEELVQRLDRGSPAHLGGLVRGDVLVAINDAAIAGLSHDEVMGKMVVARDSG